MQNVHEFFSYLGANLPLIGLGIAIAAAWVLFLSGFRPGAPYRNERGFTVEENRERKRVATVKNTASRFANAFKDLLQEPGFREKDRGLWSLHSYRTGCLSQGQMVGVVHRTSEPILTLRFGCSPEAEIELTFGANSKSTPYRFASGDEVLKLCLDYLQKKYGPVDVTV
jgi:hypothetical protein